MVLTVDEEQVAKVLIVDDQVSYAEAIGLAMSLTPDLDLVGRAHDLESARELCDRANPDVVLCDYRCLLYTSPSPRDRTRSRMPSSA